MGRQVARRLLATGRRAAFESVLVGDVVVRHLAKHWQEHGGRCQCGSAEETVDHVFWHCLRYAQQRLGNSRCGEGAGGTLKACERLLGGPGTPA